MRKNYKRNFKIKGVEFSVENSFYYSLSRESNLKYDVYMFSEHYNSWTRVFGADTLAEARAKAEDYMNGKAVYQGTLK